MPLVVKDLDKGAQYGGGEADFILHPLIHTLLKFKLAQYMVSCQRGKENPPLTAGPRASEGGKRRG